MAGAINIKSINASARNILNLWDDVSGLEEMPSMAGLNYPPHFTFAIYDEIEVDVLRNATKEVFENLSSVFIIFDKIAYFDVEELVLWASPKDKSELLELHKAIHAIIPQELCREYYRPNVWVPHCTLGFKVRPECKDAALKMVGDMALPFEVEFNYADCVEFLPVRILEEFQLD